jgi:hypothetical protein
MTGTLQDPDCSDGVAKQGCVRLRTPEEIEGRTSQLSVADGDAGLTKSAEHSLKTQDELGAAPATSLLDPTCTSVVGGPEPHARLTTMPWVGRRTRERQLFVTAEGNSDTVCKLWARERRAGRAESYLTAARFLAAIKPLNPWYTTQLKFATVGLKAGTRLVVPAQTWMEGEVILNEKNGMYAIKYDVPGQGGQLFSLDKDVADVAEACWQHTTMQDGWQGADGERQKVSLRLEGHTRPVEHKIAGSKGETQWMALSIACQSEVILNEDELRDATVLHVVHSVVQSVVQSCDKSERQERTHAEKRKCPPESSSLTTELLLGNGMINVRELQSRIEVEPLSLLVADTASRGVLHALADRGASADVTLAIDVIMKQAYSRVPRKLLICSLLDRRDATGKTPYERARSGGWDSEWQAAFLGDNGWPKGLKRLVMVYFATYQANVGGILDQWVAGKRLYQLFQQHAVVVKRGGVAQLACATSFDYGLLTDICARLCGGAEVFQSFKVNAWALELMCGEKRQECIDEAKGRAERLLHGNSGYAFVAKTASGRFQCAEFRVDEVGQAEFNSILKVARRQVATTVKMGQQSAVVETLARDGRLVSDYRLKFATKSAVTEPFEKYFRERLRRRVEARMVSQWKVGDLCWMRFKDDVEYPGEIVESNSLTQVMVVYFMEDNTTEWNVATDLR